MQNLSRAKSPELQGMKLIKSVLKKESEQELEQSMILPSSEVYPRSILKSNSYSRPIQTTSDITTRGERDLCSVVESQNSNNETAKFREELDCFNVATNHNMIQDISRDPCDEMRAIVSKESNSMEDEVPSHKTALFRNKEILPADVDNCKIDTISSSALKRCSNERHDISLVGKSNRVLDIDNDNNDDDNKNDKNVNNDGENNERDVAKGEEKLAMRVKRNDDDYDDDDENGDDNDDEGNDDDDREIHDSTIMDKKLTSVAHCAINSLTKSISQHALGDEKWKQHGLPLPGLCRSATQVIASIETSETPSVSIADRLAALHHSGTTNWKRRMVGTRIDEPHDDSPLIFEENTIKSGVLADCIEKLESAAESWKTRIVTPDAVNFTVAGKMKAVPSKDASSPFLTEANISNQKKKVPRPQWFKMRKDKGESFYIQT